MYTIESNLNKLYHIRKNEERIRVTAWKDTITVAIPSRIILTNADIKELSDKYLSKYTLTGSRYDDHRVSEPFILNYKLKDKVDNSSDDSTYKKPKKGTYENIQLQEKYTLSQPDKKKSAQVANIVKRENSFSGWFDKKPNYEAVYATGGNKNKLMNLFNDAIKEGALQVSDEFMRKLDQTLSTARDDMRRIYAVINTALKGQGLGTT